MRRLAELQAKLLDEPRLADAGFADDLDELPLAFRRPFPTSEQEVELLLAPDEWSQRASAEATGAACAHNAIETDRLRDPLDFAGALLLDDEEPDDLALDVHGD